MNSPFYKAAKLWDTLPKNVKDSDTLIELKKLLKVIYAPSILCNVIVYTSMLFSSFVSYLHLDI